MKVLGAYMLLSLAGDETPTKEGVTALLSKSGIEVEESEVDLLFSKMEAKSLLEGIKEGKSKLVALGGGGGAVPGGANSGEAGAVKGAAVEEETKEEAAEEEIDVGGGGLFGGGEEDGY